MNVLGISAFYHDSAAAFVRDGTIVAAAQEERFTRRKHDASFPTYAVRYCLNETGLRARDIDAVAFYDKPFLTFERLLETYLAFAPRGFRSFRSSMPLWTSDKLFQKTKLARELDNALDAGLDWRERLLFSEHHLSHAASAFFPSPFERAAVLTLDGVGEWATTTLAVGLGNTLGITSELRFPHSLGLLYSAFTYHAGFKVNSGEYKLMGLAPYGEPAYADRIRDHLVDIKEDGTFHLDMRYFDYCTGLTMTNTSFDRLFDGPPRRPETKITEREMNLAASVQVVTEEIMVRLARDAARKTGERNLCMAGGVALNCVANGMLARAGVFDRIWVQPAAGDAGGAVGAALAAYHLAHGHPRKASATGHAPSRSSDAMHGSFLGPRFSTVDAKKELDALGAIYREHSRQNVIDLAARALASGRALGWMQGRMEFGPRALGARSILADPRSPTMQHRLNLKIKDREDFRPFAPSVLAERTSEWFELDGDSPYMLFVSRVVPNKCRSAMDEGNVKGLDRLGIVRSDIPAVTHVDRSARIQTVHYETNPRYHDLLSRFESLTGCPVLVNTSFNVRGEPIVCSPSDAFRCFMGTELDVLVIEDLVLYKDEQTVVPETLGEVDRELD